MRLFLTTIVLVLLAQPAWAAEVYYCAMTSHATVRANEIEKHTLERFKVAVDVDQITFKGGKTFAEPLVYKIEHRKRWGLIKLRATYAQVYVDGKETVFAIASMDKNNLVHKPHNHHDNHINY